MADQRLDPNSLLNWTDGSEGLVLQYTWRNVSLVIIHSFAASPRRMRLRIDGPEGHRLVAVFTNKHSDAGTDGCHQLDLEPYDDRWYRVGTADNGLNRSAL